MKAIRLRSRQRGFTLSEVLVATAVFLVIFLGVMLLYERSNRVFKTGVESSDMQQNTRVAYDRLLSDVRMAGFDFDRDGRPSGGTTTAWKPATLYGKGALCSPTTPNGFRYQCTVAGTSGATLATEPAWPITPGLTVTDGTAKWKALNGTAEYQQPDEQIEAAGSSAITIRGNYDYETDAANDNGREPDYEPPLGEFPIVTTGNDEIVTYLLKSDRGTNSDSLTFYADVRKPRKAYPGGVAEDLVTIGSGGSDTRFDDCMTGGVWDGCKQPPYTLYRVTLQDKTYGGPTDTTWTPIASNIRSVHFKYYEDSAGTAPLKDNAATPAAVPNDGAIGGAGKYDPAAPGTLVNERLIRMKIKSVRVELVGMNEAPDLDYVNPTETMTTYTDSAGNTVDVNKYRGYSIESVVSPRNIGKHGMREQDVLPPGSPKITNVCFGECNIVTVEWDPPDPSPGTGAVEQYAVIFDNDSKDEPFAQEKQFGLATSARFLIPGGLPPDTMWYFRIKALNGFGSAVSGDWRQVAPINKTKMEAPTITAASTTLPNMIHIDFNRPLVDVAGSKALSCTDGSSPDSIGVMDSEIKQFEIYRDVTSGFTPSGANLIFAGSITTDPITGAGFKDDIVVENCKLYYYKMRAVEACAASNAYNDPADTSIAKSDYSAEVSGQAVSTAVPATPTGLTIGSSSCVGVNCTVNLSWPRVSTDTSGNPLTVSYEILRIKQDALTSTEISRTVAPDIAVPVSAIDPVSYTDNVVSGDGLGVNFKYLYQVRAVNCPSGGGPYYSGYSVQRTWPCNFDATITVSYGPAPAAFDGDGLTVASAWLVDGPTGITVSPSAAVARIKADLYDAASGAFIANLGDFVSPALPSVTFPLPGTSDLTTYRVDVQTYDVSDCVKFDSRFIEDSPSNCCLQPADGGLTVVDHTLGGGAGGFLVSTVKLFNNCDVPLTIQPLGVQYNWTKTSSSGGPKVTSMTFPTAAGGTVTDATNHFEGPVSVSPSTSGGSMIIPAGGSYKITIQWNVPNWRLDCVQIVYRRPADLANQTCKIVPTSTGTCP